jgi:uncharacterized protein
MNSSPFSLRHITGLVLCAVILHAVTHAASFDCQKATSDVEKLICGNSELSRLDDDLSKAYRKTLEQTLFKKYIIGTQKKWLKNVRNACQNTQSLRNAYKARIRELKFLSSCVTVYSWNEDPLVNLDPFQPLSEPIKAILAMYALQAGSDCRGGTGNLKCALTSSLGLGRQCSQEQLRLVGKWFREGIPAMGRYAPSAYKSAELGSICYQAPDGARAQEIWTTIKVGIRRNLIFVDAVYYWTVTADGPSGHTGYSTVYRIGKESVITVSHKRVLEERDKED